MEDETNYLSPWTWNQFSNAFGSLFSNTNNTTNNNTTEATFNSMPNTSIIGGEQKVPDAKGWTSEDTKNWFGKDGYAQTGLSILGAFKDWNAAKATAEAERERLRLAKDQWGAQKATTLAGIESELARKYRRDMGLGGTYDENNLIAGTEPARKQLASALNRYGYKV